MRDEMDGLKRGFRLTLPFIFFIALLSIFAEKAMTANVDVKIVPKARQKLILIEAETRDSSWIVASAMPRSLKNRLRSTGIGPEAREDHAYIQRELRDKGIIPTDTLVAALSRRIERYESLDSVIRDGLIERADEFFTRTVDAGSDIDRKIAADLVEKENEDRVIVINEINRQFTAPDPLAIGALQDDSDDIQLRALSSADLSQTGFDPASSAGLFVGVSMFFDPDGSNNTDIVPVPYAADDAVDLAHLFSIRLGLIDPARVTLAISSDPVSLKSRRRLEELHRLGAHQRPAGYADVFALLGKISRSAGENGLLVISVASHGYMLKGEMRQRILAQDSQMDALQYTGIPVEYLFEQASSSTAPRRILLVDACREAVAASRGLADPSSAMSEDFAKAIAGAEGTVVLQATTPGGYSYDDAERQNGVFTAAVVDGLTGGAEADNRGYVTPITLAGYVDSSVRNWVRRNRPEHADVSKGMSYRTEPAPAAQMPLAVSATMALRFREFEERKARLLEVLKGNMDLSIVTGGLVQEVAVALSEWNSTRLEPLLMELEVLENFGERYRTKFVEWWSSNKNPAQPSPAPERSRDLELAKSAAEPPVSFAHEPALVLLPGGSFERGSAAGAENEKPVRTISVSDFHLGKYEVTFDEFDAFCDATGREKPDDEGWGRGRRPVINVSWNDAMAYCAWLTKETGRNYRLPTEAEWEYAARSGKAFEYPTLTGSLDHQQGNYAGSDDGFSKTAPVGSFAANPFGIHDLAGNIWEWCADWYGPDYYSTSPADNPSGPEEGSLRVARGGCWGYPMRMQRAAGRNYGDPSTRFYNYGFRVAVSQ